MNQKPGNLRLTAWIYSAGAVATYCITAFQYWTFTDAVGVFLLWIVWIPAAWIFFVALCKGIAVIRNADGPRPFLPLCFLLLGMLAAWLIDFTSLWLNAKFTRNYQARVEMIGKVTAGKAALSGSPGISGRMKEYCGDESVTVDDTKGNLFILFIKFTGVFDNYSGFVYSADGSPPDSECFGGGFVCLTQVEPHWFLVTAT